MTAIQIPGYTLLEPLAEGGMAEVYLAVQDSLQRKVALKILKDVDGPNQSERFLCEGLIIASLEHQNIITIYDIGVHQSWHYIAMAYHEGGDLEALLNRGISTCRAIELLRSLARSLNYVHERGIVHRDVKPANVLFSHDGEPVLTDFGVAKRQQQELGLTMDGFAVGSPFYLSPEQAQGLPLDGRSDIYSLGVIFYEMLAGTKPFQGNTVMDTIVAHLQQPMPPLPKTLVQFQPVLERMLAKCPDDRYASTGELVEQLDALQAVEGSAERRHQAGMTAVQRDGHRQAGSANAFFGRWRIVAADALCRTALALAGRVAPLVIIVSLAALALIRYTMVESEPSTPANDMQVVAAVAAAKHVAEVDQAPKPGTRADNHRLLMERIDQLMVRAEQARAEERLSLPKGNSAHDYYRQVLELDSHHEPAQQGVEALVTEYIGRARREIERLRYKRARRFIARGLSIDPDNAELSAMQERAYAVSDAPRQITKNVSKLWKKNL